MIGVNTGAFLIAVSVSGALCAAQPAASSMHARPRLVPERQTVLPGEDLLVAIDFAIDEGWHTYWPGMNDTGFAMHAKIETSANATTGDLLWPAPHRYSPSEGILDHVFDERMTVLLPVHVREDATLGDTVSLRVAMRWLVCEEVCLPESAELSLTIPVAEGASRPDRDTSAMFEAARLRLPIPPKPTDGVAATMDGDRLTIEVSGAERLAFYPLEDSRRPYDLLRDGQADGPRVSIEFRPGKEPVKGVLEVWGEPSAPSRLFSVEWPEPAPPPHEAPSPRAR